MVGSSLTRTVTMFTYKKDAQGNGIDGESVAVKLPVEWLKKKIFPMEVIDFLGEYTYDETEVLIADAQREGIPVYFQK